MGHVEALKVIGKIEWVSGEIPESSSLKLIAIKDDGGILIQTGSFYADEEASAPCWHFENGEVVPVGLVEVLAWASMPTFGFNESTGFTFGDAVEALKAGKKVYRSGWNGKGMYLWMLPEARVPADWCKEPHLKSLAENNPDGSKEMHCLPSIRMKTADGKVLTGWLASQSDIFAEDWVITD